MLYLSTSVSFIARMKYVIAHRCNSLGDVEAALARGANAVECDVRVADDGVWFVDHDYCAPWATRYDAWLVDAAAAYRRHAHAALVVLDVKRCARFIDRLVDAALEAFDVEIVLSFPTVAEYRRANVRVRERVTIYFSDDSFDAALRAIRADYLEHAWIAAGVASFVPEPERVGETVERAVRARDDASELAVLTTPPIRVGVWTLERAESIRHYLVDVGVDAVTVTPSAIEDAAALR